MQTFCYFSKGTAEALKCGFFVALSFRSLVVVIGNASLKAWQTKPLHFVHTVY
jgi:hypothetical protein